MHSKELLDCVMFRNQCHSFFFLCDGSILWMAAPLFFCCHPFPLSYLIAGRRGAHKGTWVTPSSSFPCPVYRQSAHIYSKVLADLCYLFGFAGLTQCNKYWQLVEHSFLWCILWLECAGESEPTDSSRQFFCINCDMHASACIINVLISAAFMYFSHS